MRPRVGNVVLYRSFNTWATSQYVQMGIVVYESGHNFWNIRKYIDGCIYMADNACSRDITVISNSLEELSKLEKFIYGVK